MGIFLIYSPLNHFFIYRCKFKCATPPPPPRSYPTPPLVIVVFLSFKNAVLDQSTRMNRINDLHQILPVRMYLHTIRDDIKLAPKSVLLNQLDRKMSELCFTNPNLLSYLGLGRWLYLSISPRRIAYLSSCAPVLMGSTLISG